MTKILIIAGEVSGDSHAAALIDELKKINSDLNYWGIGGNALKKRGMHLFYSIDQMAFLGIGEVIRHLPFIRKVHNYIVEWAKKEKPVLAILVDYPGFNLKIAKSLYKLKIPVVYYISPQLWAWGQGRVEKMRRFVKKLLVLFPFEKKFYAEHSIDAQYVGHPLVDRHFKKLPENFKKIEKGKIKIGLLPGSRKQEISSLLPTMVKCAEVLKNDAIIDKAEILCVDHIRDDFINLFKGELSEVLPTYDTVFVASGTATLECGYYCVPMVIGYKVNFLTYFLARRLVKIKNIGLVNIVAEKDVATELIQNDFHVNNAVRELKKLLSQEPNLQKRNELKIIREKLGDPGASERAAHEVNNLVQELL